MDAWRYGIYLRVFTSISNEWAQWTSEISMWTLEDKFHISARPCIILYLYNSMETELAHAFDVMMARAKRIYILIIKVNKLFSFFSSRCFLKEKENTYSVFLSRYRNTHESLGELEKAVTTLACGSCFHCISRSPKLPLVFLFNN